MQPRFTVGILVLQAEGLVCAIRYLGFPFQTTPAGVVANVFCDIQTPRREAFTGDPRLVLRNAFIKAEDLGYVANVGPKLEIF